jgi:hypothetical protein
MANGYIWPGKWGPQPVAVPLDHEYEGLTRLKGAKRVSRDFNSEATTLSNAAPGRLHSASSVTSSNRRHYRNAGWRDSRIGHRRMTSGFAFGPRSKIRVSWGFFSGPDQLHNHAIENESATAEGIACQIRPRQTADPVVGPFTVPHSHTMRRRSISSASPPTTRPVSLSTIQGSPSASADAVGSSSSTRIRVRLLRPHLWTPARC